MVMNASPDIYFLHTFFVVFSSLPPFPQQSPENISRFYIVPYKTVPLKWNSTGCAWHKQECGTAFTLLWMSLMLENISFCVPLILVLSLIVLLTHENNGRALEHADVLPITWILKQTNVDWTVYTTEMPILYFFNVLFLLEYFFLAFSFAPDVAGIEFCFLASPNMNVNMSSCRFAQNECMFSEHLVLLELFVAGEKPFQKHWEQ